jgi:hypothetical protein
MSTLAAAARGERPGLAAPIICRLAARLEQVPDDEMREDPATAAFVLRGAQRLFGLPFVVNHFEPGLELDDAALAVAVDVAGRLAAELRAVAGVVGVLTGPATLARMGGAPAAGTYAAAARRYAEAGAAAVLVAEAPAVPAGDPAVLGDLANICRYYSIPSVLIAAAGNAPGAPVDRCLGAGDLIPAELLRHAPPADAASAWAGRGGLTLTDGDVPADADPETVTDWVELLAGRPLGAQPSGGRP